MFLLDTVPRMLVFVFMITAMLAVGLRSTTRDLRSLMATRGLLARSLLANFVIVPIIGIVLIRVLPLKPPVATALLILACTPGGISALQFTTKIKGAALLAGSGTFLMSILAVFLSPVLLGLALPGGMSVVVPYGRAVLFVLVFLLLPLVVGMVVGSRTAPLADKLAKVLGIISAVSFVTVVLLLMGTRKAAMNSVGKDGLLVMLVFILVSMLVGWLMGGSTQGSRHALATVTGMRNVALGLLIALKTFPDASVQGPLVAFSALMVPPNLLYTIYSAIRSKRAARAKAEVAE